MIRNKLFKSKPQKCLGLLAALAALLMLCPSTAVANGTVVSIPDASANQSEEVTIPIGITGVTNLGAANIWLLYNKDVVEITSVADGDLGGITYTPLDDANAVGELRMTWFSGTGNSGDFVFANIELRSVGTSGDTSSLDLEVKELVNSEGNPIQHSVSNGVLTVAARPAEGPPTEPPSTPPPPTPSPFGRLGTGGFIGIIVAVVAIIVAVVLVRRRRAAQ